MATVKIMIKPRKETDDVHELVLNNIRYADNTLNLRFMTVASLAWFSINKGKTYVDLEKYLRMHNMNTHLYASKPRIKDVKISIPYNDDNLDLIYECVYSCRPRSWSLAEVLAMNGTYARNLKGLSKTGQLCFDDKNDKKIEELNDRLDFEDFSESTILKHISEASIWLCYEKVN